MKPKLKRFPIKLLAEHYRLNVVKPGDYTSDEGPYIVSRPIMTAEKINIAIAKACGWRKSTCAGDAEQMWELTGASFTPLRTTKQLPDYVRGLDAMHEAESRLNVSQIPDFVNNLSDIVLKMTTQNPWWLGPSKFEVIHATAAQRAEAFLKTLNLWEK